MTPTPKVASPTSASGMARWPTTALAGWSLPRSIPARRTPRARISRKRAWAILLRCGSATRCKPLTGLISRSTYLCLTEWNELYLPVLDLLTPQLARNALVVADLSADDSDLLPYLERVRDPGGDWASLMTPFDAGVEVSARATAS